ncbi:MAG TPA: hypothetical protein VFV39_12080 [Limnobacter sp.]|nr:hypothetical protein [Limnobacter sp.]
MDLIQFPFERVVEINIYILRTEPGHMGIIDLAKLQGALGRIDNATAYQGLNDVFEIAANTPPQLLWHTPSPMPLEILSLERSKNRSLLIVSTGNLYKIINSTLNAPACEWLAWPWR